MTTTATTPTTTAPIDDSELIVFHTLVRCREGECDGSPQPGHSFKERFPSRGRAITQYGQAWRCRAGHFVTAEMWTGAVRPLNAGGQALPGTEVDRIAPARPY